MKESIGYFFDRGTHLSMPKRISREYESRARNYIRYYSLSTRKYPMPYEVRIREQGDVRRRVLVSSRNPCSYLPVYKPFNPLIGEADGTYMASLPSPVSDVGKRTSTYINLSIIPPHVMGRQTMGFIMRDLTHGRGCVSDLGTISRR
jgi:hypothetical protein